MTFPLCLMGSCDNTGLVTCPVLCLCDEHVDCETWEVMSEPDRQTLASRNSAASRWLCALPPHEQKQPFVNVHSGDKGWETKTYFSSLFNSC